MHDYSGLSFVFHAKLRALARTAGLTYTSYRATAKACSNIVLVKPLWHCG